VQKWSTLMSTTKHVRPVDPVADDLAAGIPVYVRRAASQMLDPAHIVSVTKRPITDRPTRRAPRSGQNSEIVGYRYECVAATIFGAETTVSIYDSVETVDVAFGPWAETKARARALDALNNPRLFIDAADVDVAQEMVLTPTYGAAVNLTAFIPDIDPSEAAAVIAEALTEKYPSVRLPRIQSRPVADVRVHVYDEQALDADGQQTYPRLVAANILEAEVPYYGGPGKVSVPADSDVTYGAPR
jgi:hypothetical protein